jgi:hypothetical protein
MEDRILQAIKTGELNAENISFKEIRGFRNETNVHDELGNGRNVLVTYEQLDQYLHSYGPMISSQWRIFLKAATFHNDASISSVSIISYGCGQGLELSMLFDLIVIGESDTGKQLRDITKKITLVDLSPVALIRAHAIVKTYCSDVDVLVLPKNLDELLIDDFNFSSDNVNIHVFSNVLDIPSFDIEALFSKILKIQGRHIFLIVSHDRNFKGGVNRLYCLEKYLKNVIISVSLKSKLLPMIEFVCHNGMPAISWEIDLEVCA